MAIDTDSTTSSILNSLIEIRDLLKISKERGDAELHWRQLHRLFEEFKERIVAAMKQSGLPKWGAGVDFVLPLGNACRPARQLKSAGLRTFSSPLDWMMKYPLDLAADLIIKGFKGFFSDPWEDEVRGKNKNNRYVVDRSTGMVSMHGFSHAKSVEEELPMFHEKMLRRGKRLKEKILAAERIGILMNRNEPDDVIIAFAEKMSAAFPNQRFYILNVWDDNTFSRNAKSRRLIRETETYSICESRFKDEHEQGADPKTNPSFWLGNVDAWRELIEEEFSLRGNGYSVEVSNEFRTILGEIDSHIDTKLARRYKPETPYYSVDAEFFHPNIKVSVIIPCYNVEKYLRECLDSVVNQTLKEIEIICINDGSKDGSLDILNEYATKDSRVVVVDQENQGVGRSRNNGIRCAKGEFIAFMDPDDWYPEDDILETLYTTAKREGVFICGGSVVQSFDGNLKYTFEGEFQNYVFPKDVKMSFKDYQYDYGFWRYVYNRRFIVDNNILFPPYIRQQDPPFLIRAMLTAGEFYALARPTYCYRVSYKTPNWKNIDRVCDFVRGLTDCLRLSKENSLAKLHAILLTRIFGHYGTRIIKEGVAIDKTSVLRLLIQSLFENVDLNLARTYQRNLPDCSRRRLLGDTPSVSVIVPVYNVEAYLKKCLDSLLNQTFKDIEIICVNDGSTDGSQKIVDEYSRKYPSVVKAIWQENSGLSAARNAGLSVARGGFVAFVDSDDFCEPTFVEELFRRLVEDSDVAFSVCGTALLWEANVSIEQKRGKENYFKLAGGSYPLTPDELLRRPVCACGKLFRMGTIRTHNILFPQGIQNEDEVFYAFYAAKSPEKKFQEVEQKLYVYRQRENSIMGTIQLAKCKAFRSDCFLGMFMVGLFLWREGIFEKWEHYFFEKVQRAFLQQKDTNEVVASSITSVLLKQFGFSHFSGKSKYPMLSQIMETYNGTLDAGAFCPVSDKNNTSVNIPFEKESSPPLISIIIPVYNTGNYLAACIESILVQPLWNIELICVDDGSSDSSPKILLEYANKDSRVKVFTQKNSGQGAARNLGLKNAQGEFIYFMDSDDLSPIPALATMYSYLKAESLDVLFFGGDAFYESITLEKNYPTYKTLYDRQCPCSVAMDGQSLLVEMWKNRSSFVSPCCMCLRREFLREFNISFPEGFIYEDNVFFFTVLAFSRRAFCIPTKLFRRRVREGSTMTLKKSFRNFNGYAQVVHELEKLSTSQSVNITPVFLSALRENVGWMTRDLIRTYSVLSGVDQEKAKDLISKLGGAWLEPVKTSVCESQVRREASDKTYHENKSSYPAFFIRLAAMFIPNKAARKRFRERHMDLTPKDGVDINVYPEMHRDSALKRFSVRVASLFIFNKQARKAFREKHLNLTPKDGVDVRALSPEERRLRKQKKRDRNVFRRLFNEIVPASRSKVMHSEKRIIRHMEWQTQQILSAIKGVQAQSDRRFNDMKQEITSVRAQCDSNLGEVCRSLEAMRKDVQMQSDRRFNDVVQEIASIRTQGDHNVNEVRRGLTALEQNTSKMYSHLESVMRESFSKKSEQSRQVAPSKENHTSSGDVSDYKLKLWWWGHPILPRIYNFGDLISPVLIEHYCNKDDFEPAMRGDGDVYATGSIIHFVPEDKFSVIIGSGLIKDEKRILKNAKIYAVRGKLTQERLGVSDVVLGDPALLLPKVFPYKKTSDKDAPIGIVPHFVHYDDERLDAYRNNPRYKIINVRAEPRIVTMEICNCSQIISSSLHGLIVADAYGIPNRRLVFADKPLLGDNFKFEDYYSSVGRSGLEATSISPEEIGTTVEFGEGYLKNIPIVQEKLHTVFLKFAEDVPMLKSIFLEK